MPMSRGQISILCTAIAASTMAATIMQGCGGLPRSRSQRPVSVERRAKAFEIDHESWAQLGYALDWRGFPRVGGGESVTFLNVYDDIVAVQESGSYLTVLEAATGQTRWSEELANRLTRFVGLTRLDQGTLLSCAEGEAYFIHMDTGAMLRRQRFEKVATTAPVITGNYIIFGTGGGELMAHSMSTGFKAWGIATGRSITREPTLVGGIVSSISQDGSLIFVNASSGTLLRRNRTAGRIGLETDPVTDGQYLFVASLDQSIYAFDPQTGARIWRIRTSRPLTEQPIVHQDTLYCSIIGEGFAAIDTVSGSRRWTAQGIDGSLVAVRGGNLLIWNGTEAVLLDPARGDVIKQVELPGITMLVPDAFVDGNLYAVSKLGVIAKFMPR